MEIHELIKNIKDDIAGDRLELATSKLKNLFEGSPLLYEVIMQEARHNNLKTHIRNGVVSFKESTIEKNKIRLSLLEIVQEINLAQKENILIRDEFAELDLSKIGNYQLHKGQGDNVARDKVVHIQEQKNIFQQPLKIKPLYAIGIIVAVSLTVFYLTRLSFIRNSMMRVQNELAHLEAQKLHDQEIEQLKRIIFEESNSIGLKKDALLKVIPEIKWSSYPDETVYLSGAVLDNMDFVKFEDLSNIDFSFASLSLADLSDQDLKKCNFYSANFSNTKTDYFDSSRPIVNIRGITPNHSTKLEGVSLDSALLDNANFTFCDLRKVNFRNAIWDSSTLETENIYGAILIDVEGLNQRFLALAAQYGALTNIYELEEFIKRANEFINRSNDEELRQAMKRGLVYYEKILDEELNDAPNKG